MNRVMQERAVSAQKDLRNAAGGSAQPKNVNVVIQLKKVLLLARYRYSKR